MTRLLQGQSNAQSKLAQAAAAPIELVDFRQWGADSGGVEGRLEQEQERGVAARVERGESWSVWDNQVSNVVTALYQPI